LTYILGLNAYHGDSSACLLKDGRLIAAAEEERFRRIKHWAGFPAASIRYCLAEGNLEITDIDHVAVNRDPKANLLHKALFALRRHPSLDLIRDRFRNAVRVRGIKGIMAQELGVRQSMIKAQVHHVEHHLAHLASAFLVSPFNEAAVVSVDGFGDFVGAMWGVGKGHRMEVKERILFPHSLGLYYLALTQFLGFPRYGDEYKVMGLAAFGEPSARDKMQQIVSLNSNGRFQLDLRFFIHQSEGVTMSWDGGEPRMGPVYSREMEALFGPARSSNEPIERRHKNLAASLQEMYEEAFFHLLNGIYDQTKSRRLCLSGGCAMNSVANGKVFDRTPFEEIYIQAAAGDAGGALGAACYVWNQELKMPRNFVMDHVYWGPCFSGAEIGNELSAWRKEWTETECTIEQIEDTVELCKTAAKAIADGKVVGWFQGRMEWGPRALGNRSILADPRRADMKDVLNQRIKNREPFRPFAPSVLLEKAGTYFEKDYPEPFMLKVYLVRPEKQAEIPAVTHVDGTGRLQTVKREDTPLYWQLIREFERLTGVPMVLNTSFNENEPIVCTPREAIDCFLRTKMDVLVIGEYVVRKGGSGGVEE